MAGTDEPEVTVLTPVRDEAAVLRDTAASILAQDWSGSMEILFIDGRSTDGTRAIVEELAGRDPRVRLLDNPEGRLASALRIGLAAARGRYVAKMDAHTFFPPSYISQGVARLRRGDVNWVSGPPIPFGVEAGSRRVALALGTRMGVGGSNKWTRGEDERELDTGVFSGVWTRAALLRVGGWDAGWPVNEDSELASRFLAAGERIVSIPSMGARYIPRSTIRGLARQYGRYGFYRVKTASRHPSSLRASILLPPALTAAVLAGALGGPRARRLAAPALCSYAVALTVVSARVIRSAPERREAALLPVVFLTIHLAFGAGFLAGCLRFGVPLAALERLVRRALPFGSS